jgi:hypothetical protein
MEVNDVRPLAVEDFAKSAARVFVTCAVQASQVVAIVRYSKASHWQPVGKIV